MAKPTKAEREAYLSAIQNSVQDTPDSSASVLKSIQSILRDQSESLKKVQEHTGLSTSHAEDSYLLLVEIKDSITDLSKQWEQSFDKMIQASSLSQEDRTETAQRNEAMLKSLNKINDTLENNKTDNKDVEKDSGSSLGAILSGIAISLGALAGVFAAQVANIKFWTKLLTPKDLQEKVGKAITSIKEFFVDVVKRLKAVVEPIIEMVKKNFTAWSRQLFQTLDNMIISVMNAFNKLGGGGLIKKIKEVYAAFEKPFVEAFDAIKGLGKDLNVVEKVKGFFEPITKAFTGITEGVGKFGTLFEKSFKFFKAIAKPITIILTIFDTLEGAIDGFQEGLASGGILDALTGGILGAIKGFVNSFIMSFADAIKDIVSWTLDLFGFENLSKMLDSFSFVDIFTDFIDNLEDKFRGIENFFIDISNSFNDMIRGIGIPEFTIPNPFGEDFKIGPFYPFSGLENTQRVVTHAEQKATKAPVETAQPAAIEKTKEESLRAPVQVEKFKGTDAPTGGFIARNAPDLEKPKGTDAPTGGFIARNAPDLEKPKGTDAPTGGFIARNAPDLTEVKGTVAPTGGFIARNAPDLTEVKGTVAPTGGYISNEFVEKPKGTDAPTPGFISRNAPDATAYTLKPAVEKATYIERYSAENANMKESANAVQAAPIVSAPTVNNVSNSTTNQSIKLPTRNSDNTVGKYFISRYSTS